jgi:formylglycine-generating enzyme required for sulfatase activity
MPIGALPVALLGFAPLFLERFALSPRPLLAAAAALVLLLVGLWFVIEAGVLAGSPGANRYGSGSGQPNSADAGTLVFHRVYCIAGAVSLVALAAVGIASNFAIRDSRAVSAFRDCPTCPEMIEIPGGMFMMGLDRKVANMRDGRMEQAATAPVHRVDVPSFALGKYEVTFEEWDACVKDGGCRHSPSDAGWGRGKRPVIGVSWSSAYEYSQWLARKTGKSYRLPSEAEWEYAARAGSAARDRFVWRKLVAEKKRVCRFENNADLSYEEGKDKLFPCISAGKQVTCPIDRDKCRDGFATTAPVGSLAPNYFGLHDMQGNVAEWVQDCWHDDYTGAPIDGTAWVADDCTARVIRGQHWRSWWQGPWNGWGEYAARTFSPDNHTDFTGAPDATRGFRVARGG